MGFWKDLLIGGAAYKALKQSSPPGIVAPPTCTIVGMKHIGLGSKWRIYYIKNDSPNLKRNFTISKGTSVMTSGSDKWKFHWN
tara:strand:- start:584 stop:832 length:249 start_codon:yes stop_codon:yes gene_type:complete